jgi:hypothetical protein
VSLPSRRAVPVIEFRRVVIAEAAHDDTPSAIAFLQDPQ